MGELIVTARKRDEKLQDVPVAIAAFSQADLQRNGVQSLTQLATMVPQLAIAAATTPAGGVITLRGIGSSGLTASADQAVSLNLDGIQLSQATAIQLGAYDMQRIEVLKGPQALFYGKNSPAGVISLVGAEPGEKFEARLRTGYEFSNSQKFGELMLSGPITSALRARVVGYVSGEDGWFRNLARPIAGTQALTGATSVGSSEKTSPDQTEYFVRGTLVYQPDAGSFDAKLKVSHGRVNRKNGATASNQVYNCTTGIAQDYGSFYALLPGLANDCKLDRNYVDPDFGPQITATSPYYRDGKPYYENQQTLISLTANYHPTDDLLLTSVSGYYHQHDQWSGSFLGSEIINIANANANTAKQFTEELRLTSSYTTPLNFMVGGFYQNFKFTTFSVATFAPPLLPFVALGFDDHFHQTTNAYSVFGQLIYRVAERWEVTAGARYSYEKKEAAGIRYPSIYSGFTLLPLNFDRPTVRSNNLSPEATISYKPSSDLTLYGAFRTGFVSGGYNLAAAMVPGADGKIHDGTFRPATALGGEIGAKGVAVDNQLHFDVTLYNYRYKNLQVSAANSPSIGLALRNAASATVRGIETSLVVTPKEITGLQLRSSVSYNHGRYDSFPNAACYGGQTQAMGCNKDLVSAGPPPVYQAQDLSGRPLLRSSDWAMNFGANYEFPLAGDMTLSTSADASYTGSYYPELESDPRSLQPSSWRIDAAVALHGQKDTWDWELALIGKNLTNQLRIVNGFALSGTGTPAGTVGPSVLADKHGSVSDPRTLMLQLTLRY